LLMGCEASLGPQPLVKPSRQCRRAGWVARSDSAQALDSKFSIPEMV
jgi:hypothetical protein